jgi:DNA mismatch endonuclease (patch repair protein)
MERVLKATLTEGVFGEVSPSRSRLMGKIKSKGNKTTETRLRLAFVRAGLSGWQMHRTDVAGCPDFYFSEAALAVFVDGCFWHGCARCGHIPKTRRTFWKTKFERNRVRSRKVGRLLQLNGIRVVRFWEHEIKHSADGVARRVARLLSD